MRATSVHGLSIAELREAVGALPVETRESLAPLFQPSVLRAARIAERNALVLRLAISLPGSDNSRATTVQLQISRYAGSHWRYERDRDAPSDQRHVILHRILRLNGGEVPEAETLRKVIGLGKKTAAPDQPPA